MEVNHYLALIGFGEIGWGWQFLAEILLTIQISACAYLVGLGLGLFDAWGKLSGNQATFAIAEV